MTYTRSIYSALMLLAFGMLSIQTATAQCADFSAYPGGKDEAETKHVLYRDLVGQGQLDKAYEMWADLYKHSPGGNEYHFVDGIKITKHRIEKAATPDEKAAIYKELMSIHDQYVECYGTKKLKSLGGKAQKGQLMARKASDMYDAFTRLGVQVDVNTMYAAYKAAVTEQGDDSGYYVFGPYAYSAVTAFSSDAIDKGEAREVYNTLLAIADNNIANPKDDATLKYYQDAKATVQSTFKPVEAYIFDCDYFYPQYKQMYDSNPNDRETYREVYSKLVGYGCDKNDPMLAEIKGKDAAYIAQGKAEAAAANAANAPTANKASEAYKAGNYSEAVKLYKVAIGETDDNMKKSKYAYAAAQIAYGKLKQYSTARSLANEAAKYRSGWGEPYLLIGRMYASSGRACGPGTGWDSQIVIFPALDMWAKAKRVDPSVAGEANKLIGKYSGYLPSKSDAFMKKKKKGDSIRIGCWIQTTSTVRTK